MLSPRPLRVTVGPNARLGQALSAWQRCRYRRDRRRLLRSAKSKIANPKSKIENPIAPPTESCRWPETPGSVRHFLLGGVCSRNRSARGYPTDRRWQRCRYRRDRRRLLRSAKSKIANPKSKIRSPRPLRAAVGPKRQARANFRLASLLSPTATVDATGVGSRHTLRTNRASNGGPRTPSRGVLSQCECRLITE